MNQKNDLADPMHRETNERLSRQKENERDLVETMFEKALTRQKEEKERALSLAVPGSSEAILHARQNSLASAERTRGVHYTEFLEARPGDPLAEEWNTYRREVGRLLAEGQEGRHVLVKGQEIIGIFDTSEAAHEAGLKRYLREPFFVHAIRAEEPYLRIRGINHPWHSSLSQ